MGDESARAPTQGQALQPDPRRERECVASTRGAARAAQPGARGTKHKRGTDHPRLEARSITQRRIESGLNVTRMSIPRPPAHETVRGDDAVEVRGERTEPKPIRAQN